MLFEKETAFLIGRRKGDDVGTALGSGIEKLFSGYDKVNR
jgi:hypothetical protein